ncbi:MAG: replicative DNA helicase [Planctomycetota bacterium]
MDEGTLKGRVPPRSEEAERALLGAMLLDSARIPEVCEIVTADDFSEKRHVAIFRCLQGLADQGVPVDFISAGEKLRAMGMFHEVGGAEYLVDLASQVTSAAHAVHHAGLVADTAVLRRLIRVASDMMSEAFDTHPDGDAVRRLVDDCEQRIFSVGRREEGGGAAAIADAIRDAFHRIDAASHREGLTGLTTGFVDLDQLLCGLNSGDLVVLASRPSMGKTAMALNFIENAAMSRPAWLDRAPVILLFSLEMGRQQLVSRMLCSLARVDAHLLRSGRIPKEDRSELTSAADQLSRTRIFIDDTSNLTMMSLRGRARRLKAREGLDMIVVDYLQLLSFPGLENRQQEISTISRSLKGIARELNVPVVALAQLSRQVELRDPPRPKLADLRESGSIEQDADVVLMLYRPEYYDPQKEDLQGVAEVICTKQRNGPTGTVKLRFFQSTMRFESWAPTKTEPLSIY